jgi:hypothetical protein
MEQQNKFKGKSFDQKKEIMIGDLRRLQDKITIQINAIDKCDNDLELIQSLTKVQEVSFL